MNPVKVDPVKLSVSTQLTFAQTCDFFFISTPVLPVAFSKQEMRFLYYLSKKNPKLSFLLSWMKHVNTMLKLIILCLKKTKKQVFN